MGEQLGTGTMVEYMERFGMYADPKLNYPDDQMIASGVRNQAGDLVEDSFDVGRVAIGQGGEEGQAAMTPLQMAEVAAAVANGGDLMKPNLLQEAKDPDGRTIAELDPDRASGVMSDETAEQVTEMMVNVTEEGTAAGLSVGGVSFAGKTGTAEIDVAAGINRPWFIGFAPADDPQVAVAAMIEHCQAAPAARSPGRSQPPSCRACWRAERMARLEAGKEVDGGRYTLISRLGSGGMADVWLADDTMLGRKVALKFLHERFASDTQFVERFRREAQSAAGLQHPNVVGVYDRGEWDGTHYIAMEYVQGAALKDLIERGVTVGEAVEITRQILAGASFAHERGIVHRDLKPGNVLVDAEGRARVTDFGIARAGASEITQTGSVLGTAHYLSPEQAQGLEVNAPSDLYSVGVILYEALTGQVPFDGDSAVTIALKQVSEQPKPPSQLNPAVTPALDSVVLKALAKDPANRFATAEEFTRGPRRRRGRPERDRRHGRLRGRRRSRRSRGSGRGRRGHDGSRSGGGGDGRRAGGGQGRAGRRLDDPQAALIIAAIVLLLGGVAAFALTRPEQVPVPKVTEETQAQAAGAAGGRRVRGRGPPGAELQRAGHRRRAEPGGGEGGRGGLVGGDHRLDRRAGGGADGEGPARGDRGEAPAAGAAPGPDAGRRSRPRSSRDARSAPSPAPATRSSASRR